MGARFVFCHDTVTKHLKNDLSTDLANVSSKFYIKTALEKLDNKKCSAHLLFSWSFNINYQFILSFIELSNVFNLEVFLSCWIGLDLFLLEEN